jgi:hypothetical protein
MSKYQKGDFVWIEGGPAIITWAAGDEYHLARAGGPDGKGEIVDCEEHDIDCLLMRVYVPHLGDWVSVEHGKLRGVVVDVDSDSGDLWTVLFKNRQMFVYHAKDMTLLHRWEPEEAE